MNRDGARALSFASGVKAGMGEGERSWLDLSAGSLGVEAAAVDAYAARRVANDPDLCIAEIEDRAGRHFLTEPVAKG